MKSKEEKGKKITYVRAKSLDDIARLAFGDDFSSRSLICSPRGKKNRITLLGEHVGSCIIAYYVESEGTCKGISYSSDDSGERVEVVAHERGMDKNFIDVFHVEIEGLKDGKPEKDSVAIIKAGSFEDLAKMAIKASVKDESIRHLYSFEYKGKRIIGGFDLIEELNDEARNFYYTLLSKDNQGKYIAYDYKTGRIEFTDRMREYSYMYLKIINLAEAFPFFNVPD